MFAKVIGHASGDLLFDSLVGRFLHSPLMTISAGHGSIISPRS